MVTQATAHRTSDAWVRLSGKDLETIELALRVLLQSSTREEHIFEAIREALSRIEEALRQPEAPREAS